MQHRISLTIEADSANDLLSSLLNLTAALGATLGVTADTANVALETPEISPEPATSPTPATELDKSEPPAGVVEQTTPRRGRRKKAEASTQVATSTALTTPPAQPATLTASDVTAMFDDTQQSRLAVTKDALRQIGNEHMAKLGFERTLAIVKEYGVDKISLVPEDKWPELYDKFAKGLQQNATQQNTVLQ